jgi:hypothetical protein
MSLTGKAGSSTSLDASPLALDSALLVHWRSTFNFSSFLFLTAVSGARVSFQRYRRAGFAGRLVSPPLGGDAEGGAGGMASLRVSDSKDAEDPALPVQGHRPLGGDAPLARRGGTHLEKVHFSAPSPP